MRRSFLEKHGWRKPLGSERREQEALPPRRYGLRSKALPDGTLQVRFVSRVPRR